MPSQGFDPSAIAPALANRVLERETWAQSCLAAHGGSVFVIAVGPVATTMRVNSSGKVEAALPGSPADLELALSPLSVPTFLADPRRWDEFVVASGNPALAATLKGLAETLPWFVERVFAEALGPIVGQRVADAGRQLLAFPGYAAARVGESIASFVRNESGLAASNAEARSLSDAVAAIRTRAEALEARLDALSQRLAAVPPAQPPG